MKLRRRDPEPAPGPISAEEFRTRVAGLLEELCGDEGRLWLALRDWWERVRAEG